MCGYKVRPSRLLLSSWTGLGASGTEKQSGTQDASGKCSSWGLHDASDWLAARRPLQTASNWIAKALARVPAHPSQLRPV